MRATFFIYLVIFTIFLLFWIFLSGWKLILCSSVFFLMALMTLRYCDKIILYFLGARQVKSTDEREFIEAAFQEAYKLCVSKPSLYFYNGSLERVFVLQRRQNISLIISRTLLDRLSSEELHAICFELLLQVKNKTASKRTRVMFLLGFISWFAHSFIGVIYYFFPFKEFKKVMNWTLNYFLLPFMTLLFHMMLGRGYFRKLENSLADFTNEKKLLGLVGLKLQEPSKYSSLSVRKIMELSSLNKSRHFQRILALEFLPHEWDFLFNEKGEKLI